MPPGFFCYTQLPLRVIGPLSGVALACCSVFLCCSALHLPRFLNTSWATLSSSHFFGGVDDLVLSSFWPLHGTLPGFLGCCRAALRLLLRRHGFLLVVFWSFRRFANAAYPPDSGACLTLSTKLATFFWRAFALVWHLSGCSACFFGAVRVAFGLRYGRSWCPCCFLLPRFGTRFDLFSGCSVAFSSYTARAVILRRCRVALGLPPNCFFEAASSLQWLLFFWRVRARPHGVFVR